MMWAALIVVSSLMLALFFGVTVAGGRAHDRQNAEIRRREQGEMPAVAPKGNSLSDDRSNDGHANE